MSNTRPESAKLLPSSSDEDNLQFQVDDVDAGDTVIDLANPVSMLLSKNVPSPRPNESKDLPNTSKSPKVTPNHSSPLRLSTDQSEFPCTSIPKLDEGTPNLFIHSIDLQRIFQAFDIECEQEGDSIVLHCSLPVYRPSFRVHLPLAIKVIPEGELSYTVQYHVKMVNLFISPFLRYPKVSKVDYLHQR